jgi:hypothetical protein
LKTIYYDPDNKLIPQLKKMVVEYENSLKAHEHLGKALTVPVQPVSLLDFKYPIIQQCMRLVKHEK